MIHFPLPQRARPAAHPLMRAIGWLCICIPLVGSTQALAADESNDPPSAARPPATMEPAGLAPAADNQAVAAPPAPVSWSLRLPKEEVVSYKGLARFDNAGGPGAQILYPAPGIAGLLVAIATHGIIVDAQKKAEKDRIQAAADAVLAPYRQVTDAFTYRALMQQGLQKTGAANGSRLIEYSIPIPNERVIESVPAFFMTADARALVMDAAIVVYVNGKVAAPAYQNVVRVVSEPLGGADPAEAWKANQGDNLKTVSAALFALALDVVFKEMDTRPSEVSPVDKTIRYLEGGAERMERGRLISAQCNRVLIRNLRGWLMSLPALPGSAGTEACPRPASTAQVPG